MAPPGNKEQEAKDRLEKSKVDLQSHCDQESPDLEVLQAAVKEAEDALANVNASRKAKPKPDDVAFEQAVQELIEKANGIIAKINEELKKVKEAARKRMMAASQKAAPFTGDRTELEQAVAEAEEANVPDKEIVEAKGKLTDMISFHFMLDRAANELAEVTAGEALTMDMENLEMKVQEVKEGAAATLQKTVIELYLGLLTKPAPTAVATDTLDATIAEAIALGVDESVIKPMKKRNEESKKAQNAKKIADRKAKKPPADPPKPPDPPEAHPDVQLKKDALETALAAAEAKLLEAKSSRALKKAQNEKLLTSEALLDLGERKVDEPHPNIAALDEALKAAVEAKATEALTGEGKAALEGAIKTRAAARTALAKAQLQEAASTKPISTDVTKLGGAIAVAKGESVDEADVKAAEDHLYNSYKTQAEGVLEPLAAPEPLRHEGFEVIDPLTKALEEARKRGAVEDLLVKGQAKLDYWLEARTRRDKAKKALDASLAPPPVTVNQKTVQECLAEASDARLDPKLLEEATNQLKVAELAQRVYEKAKAPPGQLAIDVLAQELEVVGGGALALEQEKQGAMERTVEMLNAKIDALKETKESQKQRDAALAKQMKKGATKQKAASKFDEPILPAWVKRGGEDDDDATGATPDGRRGSVVLTVADKQDEEMKELTERLKIADEELKAQVKVVEGMTGTVVVPQDVVKYAQLKLKASMTCDEMQLAQQPPLLDLDCERLQLAIKASEFKFGELPIAGLDDLDCNVPKAEIVAAKKRLVDAQKAQQRQAKARQQLTVRVNAPTGTATFDLLVKLVAEAKEAGVEAELVRRAELKLKKMEELAASSLRAGPLAFVSFHCPCLRSCVSQYAISLVEQAEEKRREVSGKQEVAFKALMAEIGDWEKGVFDETLDVEPEVDQRLKDAIANAAHEGLAQEVLDIGRYKLAMIEKYRRDKAAGKIKVKKPKTDAEAEEDPSKKKKPKFKNYGYVKKVEDDE